MVKLCGENIYLTSLEKDHCRRLLDDYQYDFNLITEPLNIGHANFKADIWFDEIQKDQGNKHIRLGIFLMDGTVIGDVALQDVDFKNRCCSIGIGFAKIKNRSKGYGTEAVKLLLEYGFNNIGIERISANTLKQNIPAQHLLKKLNFKLEGIEKKAVYLGGEKCDRLNYAILIEDYNK